MTRACGAERFNAERPSNLIVPLRELDLMQETAMEEFEYDPALSGNLKCPGAFEFRLIGR